MKRRRFLTLPALAVGAPVAAQVDYPRVEPRSLSFPRDHGAHPAFRTEWWYITGWVSDDARRDYGVQVTFFRNRPGVAEGSASAFAARQPHHLGGDLRRGRQLQRAIGNGCGKNSLYLIVGGLDRCVHAGADPIDPPR